MGVRKHGKNGPKLGRASNEGYAALRCVALAMVDAGASPYGRSGPAESHGTERSGGGALRAIALVRVQRPLVGSEATYTKRV